MLSNLARSVRTIKNLPLKLPLEKLTIVQSSEEVLHELKILEKYISLELNVKKIEFTSKETNFIKLTAKLDQKRCGGRFRALLNNAKKEVENWDHQRVKQFITEKTAQLLRKTIDDQDVIVVRQFIGDDKKLAALWNDKVLVVLDVVVEEELRKEFVARTVANHIQKLRKNANIHPTDKISVYMPSKQRSSFGGPDRISPF